VELGLDDGKQQVAEAGVDLIRLRMGTTFMSDTGHTRGLVMVNRVLDDRVIQDGNRLYGAWLEGTSRRNAATRFKGYHIYRRSTQEIDRLVPGVVDKAIRQRLEALR
jgi:hypothetical protein